MKAKVLTIVILLMTGFWATFSSAQIVTTASSTTSCPGGTVSIPILVDNLAGVASISLTLKVDPSVIFYTSSTSNPALAGGFLVVNCQAPYHEVKAAWFGLSPVTLASGSTLFTFNFNYLQGSAMHYWDTITIGNCQYSDLGGNTLPAYWVNGTVNPAAAAPVFNLQPMDVSVAEGGNAQFTAIATGADEYQWYESADNGNTYTALNDGGMYAGTGTDNLTLSGVNLGMNGYLYRLMAKENACNQEVTSLNAVLTVTQTSNNILIHAVNVSSCANTPMYVPVDASNFDNVGMFHFELTVDPAMLAFTGMMNVNPTLGTVQSSVAGNTVSIDWTSATPVTLGNSPLFGIGFNYLGGAASVQWNSNNCQIQDGNGQDIPTDYFNSTVNPLATAPVINTQPANQTVIENQTANFSIAASGANTYQWQESANGGSSWANLSNNTTYSGATTNALTISGVPLTYNGNQYRCIATETVCNLSTSSIAGILTVTPATTDIVTTIGSITTCPDTSVSIFIPINVTNFNNVASASMKIAYDTTVLTYVNTVNVHPALGSGVFASNAAGGVFGMAWFSIIPASFGTGTLYEMEFVYTANSTNLVFDLTPGTSLYTDLNFNTLPAVWVDGFVTLPGPVITTMPTDQTVFAGTNAVFSLSGNSIDTYQWQMNQGGVWTDLTDGTVYSGTQTSALTVSNVTLVMDGNQYRCVVTGICDDQYSHVVTLMVINATPVAVSLPTVSQCQGPITIPVTVADFNDVGSFRLKLNTTGNVLVYNGYQNVNPAFLSGLTVSNTANSVTVQFTSTTPVSIPNGVMFELKFNTNAGTTALTWDPAPGINYFKSINNTVLPSTFGNGNVTITPVPGPSASIQGPGGLCQGAAPSTYTTLGAANATSYLWGIIPTTAGTIAGTGTSITVTWDAFFTGLATITVQGVNACGNGPIMTKAVTVTPTPNVTLAPFANICTNDTLLLTGGLPAGGTYSGTGVVDSLFIPAVSGVGTFTITYTFSASGCTASASQPITVNQSPNVTFVLPANLDTVHPAYPPFQLSGGLPAGGTYSGPGIAVGSNTFTPSLAGPGYWQIDYTYTTPQGCTGIATQHILVDPTMGLTNAEGNVDLIIQPNPTKGKVNVMIGEVSELTALVIFNDLGQKVYEETLQPKSGSVNRDLDLSNQPRGLYFLKLSSSKAIRIEKIILN